MMTKCVCNESYEVLQNSIGEFFAVQLVTGVWHGVLTGVYNLGVDSTDPDHRKHRMYAIELNAFYVINADAILQLIHIHGDGDEETENS